VIHIRSRIKLVALY